ATSEPDGPADCVLHPSPTDFSVTADHQPPDARRPIPSARHPWRGPGQPNLPSSTHAHVAATYVPLRRLRHGQGGTALARGGELPPGFVDVLHFEIRERLQDRVGQVTLLQVPLYRGNPDPGASEHRSAGVHTTPLFDAARIAGRPPGRAIDAQPQRIQENHLIYDDLVRA